MPFKVVPVGNKFKIYNTDKEKYVNKEFKTMESAKKTIVVYLAYDKKKSLDIPKWNKNKNLKR